MTTAGGASRSVEITQIFPNVEIHDHDCAEKLSSQHVERLRIAAGIMAQYDRQNAVEVHTIFRVNGKAVGVVERNGQIIFETAGDFRAAGGLRPSDEAGERGLSGESYMDFVATRIARNLVRKYGNSFAVERYDVGSAPTMGELREEMFGHTRERLQSMALESAYGSQSGELLDGILIFPKL